MSVAAGMFFNRELSWIDFNQRVLQEAARPDLPLFERLKFLAITASNFDEFFMVRVATLQRAVQSGDLPFGPTRERPSEQLVNILGRYRDFLQDQYRIHDEILGLLRERGIHILTPEEITNEQRLELERFFEAELFNVLAPAKVDSDRPFPFTAGLRLNLAFLLVPNGNPEQERLVILEIPSYLARFHPLPAPSGERCFIRIEDAIRLFADKLFLGYEVRESLSFRITRDADLPVEEEKEDDFVEAMNRILQHRRHSHRVRLELHAPGAARLKEKLLAELEMDSRYVFNVPGPLALRDFMAFLSREDRPDLNVEPWEPVLTIPDSVDLWQLIRERDLLLYHPYHAFSPVVRLLGQAADDPNVLSIRMTLYRTGGDSPIVEALARAAENGKQVLVLVELKARFDEEQNLGWAQRLERVGCIVIYGVANLKVHAKAMLVIRREEDGIRRYAHLSTGNYHVKTSRLYTDLGLFTSRREYTYEVARFFNAITGYSAVQSSTYIVMAPHHLKKKLLSLLSWLTEEARLGVPARVRAKMNALADEDVIRAIYQAAQAGVRFELNVRGICMLNPEWVPGASIRVVSIVDRFLEHARIFCFEAGNRREIFLASADWMYRNLERRVELMFQVVQEDLREEVLRILDVLFSDNTNAHVLHGDGHWERLTPPEGQEPIRAQVVFQREAEEWRRAHQGGAQGDLVVRRRI